MNTLALIQWLREVRDAPLTHAQRSVALALALRARNGEAWPSMATLSNDSQCKPTAARGAIRQLEAFGLVRVGWSAGRLANTYRLTMAAPPAADDPEAEQEPAPNPSASRKVSNPTLRLGDANPSARRRQPFGQTNPECTKNERKNEEVAHAASRERATPIRLPQNWQPDPAAVAWIGSFGLSPEEAAPVVEEFRSYWSARSKRYADWSLAFRRNPKAEASLIRLRNAKNGTAARYPAGGPPEPTGAAYKPFVFE